MRASSREGYRDGFRAAKAEDPRHIGLRWAAGTWEARCVTCLEWWPLDLDHWRPSNGLRRCLACWRVYKTAKAAGYREDDAVKATKNEAGRARYWANREQFLAASKVWRDAHREQIRAYNRAYQARHRDELRAKAKAYYDEARPVILAKKRAAYRGEATT